jgi:hypothetical protein
MVARSVAVACARRAGPESASLGRTGAVSVLRPAGGASPRALRPERHAGGCCLGRWPAQCPSGAGARLRRQSRQVANKCVPRHGPAAASFGAGARGRITALMASATGVRGYPFDKASRTCRSATTRRCARAHACARPPAGTAVVTHQRCRAGCRCAAATDFRQPAFCVDGRQPEGGRKLRNAPASRCRRHSGADASNIPYHCRRQPVRSRAAPTSAFNCGRKDQYRYRQACVSSATVSPPACRRGRSPRAGCNRCPASGAG